MTLRQQPVSVVELEPDAAGQECHDELVEAHALPLSLSDKASVEAGGHSDEDLAARVHGGDSSAYAIDSASSTCDTAAMPYVITTKTPEPGIPAGPWGHNVTRHVVATLDEAQRWVNNRREQDALNARPWPADVDSVIPWIATRCTVGPLPDGTVIEVERVEAMQLYRMAGLPLPDPSTLPTDIDSDAAYWRKMYEERIAIEDEGFAVLLAERDRLRDANHRLWGAIDDYLDDVIDIKGLRQVRDLEGGAV